MTGFTSLRVSVLSLLAATILNGCDKAATSDSSATASSASQYDYRVNPALDAELKKRVPELLIVNHHAECLHYSTGYAPGHFLETVDALFKHIAEPNTTFAVTDEMREEFKAQYPAEVAAITQSINERSAALPEDARAALLNRLLDETIEREATAYSTKKPMVHCDQSLDEHLSWIVDRAGNPVTRESVLKPDALTVLQYRNDTCQDCKNQQTDINAYIRSRHLFVNYIFIERPDATQ